MSLYAWLPNCHSVLHGVRRHGSASANLCLVKVASSNRLYLFRNHACTTSLSPWGNSIYTHHKHCVHSTTTSRKYIVFCRFTHETNKRSSHLDAFLLIVLYIYSNSKVSLKSTLAKLLQQSSKTKCR